MKRTFVFSIALSLGLFSCQKDDPQVKNDNPQIPENIQDLQVPGDFNYATVEEVSASIQVNGLDDQPLAGKRITFYTADPDLGGQLLGTLLTNPAGMAEGLIPVPTRLDELFVKVHASGFASTQSVTVAPQLNLSFGGRPAPRQFKGKMAKMANTPIPVPGSNKYFYVGTFSSGNNGGLPNYLEPVGDNLSTAFLDDVDASLPESKPVPTNNPQYLTVGNELDVKIVEKSDVWITFVTEGAGFRNALGYYVFDSNNPPSSPNDIDSVFIILPNASLQGANGALQAGDKVKIGTFEAGKTISWVLFQDAWNGTDVVVNDTKFYSRIAFNAATESDPTKRQHTVQLADIGREILLNGFEDQTRSQVSDNDFNDLVFYVTANPWEGIDIGNIPPVTPDEDDDGDGVGNENDDFPNDATKAVQNDYDGTLAFEDLWPSEGDYDFNDLVIDYQISHILNGANQVVEIDADWTVEAIGAAFANGFGYQFNSINGGAIASVSGQDLQEGIINTNGNGTESGQSVATVIAFDNVFNLMQSAGGSFVNTVPGNPYVTPVTVNNKITFASPQIQAQVGLPPYNSFIFVNGIRGREVHLADRQPTDLADAALFGTGDDDTEIGGSRSYKTENNLPWAIHIDGNFDYPVEYAPVDDAYLFFSQWAISGGNQSEDWYLDLSGYRDASKIY